MKRPTAAERPPALGPGQARVFVQAWKFKEFPEQMLLSDTGTVTDAGTCAVLPPELAQVIPFLFQAASTGLPENTARDRFCVPERTCGIIPNIEGSCPPIIFTRGDTGWHAVRTTERVFNKAKSTAA